MYKVLCDNALMCDSRIEELALLNPVVKLEENKAGSFSFKIPPKHPFYDVIKKRKSIVEVYRDEELLFSGMCNEVNVDFYKQKEIFCEGELSYFNDSIQRPARYQGITVRGLLEAYINNHNAQVEESKHFQVGMVTVTDPNNYLYCFTNMESTMKAMKEDLIDDLGGFFRIRHEDGVRYLDYLAESPKTNTQVIKLGKNLIDFKSNIDITDIATAIIPLGAKVEEGTVEGLEIRLTIESVNNGLDYVHSAEAVENYGWIYKTIEFDEVTNAATLKSKGEKYLAETQFENVVIEAKAIDLHSTDSDIESFKLLDQIRVYSAPHGLNRYFRLTKQTLNLNNPEKDTITLGKNEKVSMSAKSVLISEEIKKAVESIVPPAQIVNQAVANATQLITNAMGGYVVKTQDELLIMDTPNIETATKVWRWNINGLAYSSTGYDGEYALAMTMDGHFVADAITVDGLEVGKNVKMGEDAVISWEQVEDAPDIPNDEYITQIAKDAITAKHINAMTVDITGALTTTGATRKARLYGEGLQFYYQDSICGAAYAGRFTDGQSNATYGLLLSNQGGDAVVIGSYNDNVWKYVMNDGMNPVINISGGGKLTATERHIFADDLRVFGTIVYGVSSATASDRNIKDSIEKLDSDKSANFIYSLRPSKYKYKDGTSNRYHHGLIADEVKESMGDEDWGVYIEIDEFTDAEGNTDSFKCIRYEELIADLIATVQSQNERIKVLEERMVES